MPRGAAVDLLLGSIVLGKPAPEAELASFVGWFGMIVLAMAAPAIAVAGSSSAHTGAHPKRSAAFSAFSAALGNARGTARGTVGLSTSPSSASS